MPVLHDPAETLKTAATAVATEQPSSSSTAPRPSRLMALARWVLVIVCLFQTSLLVSLWFKARHGSHAEPDEHTAAVKSVPPADHAKNQITSTPLDFELPDTRLGEAHLRDGEFALALPHFWPARADAKANLADKLQFRAALCLEGLARLPEALGAYREVVAKTSDERLATAAQVAQARMHVRTGNAGEAKHLLLPLLLQAGEAGRFDAALQVEARYLLAMALSREAFGDQPLAHLDETPVRISMATWPIVHSLDWIAPPAKATPPAGDGKGGVHAPVIPKPLPPVLEGLQRHGPKEEDLLLHGVARQMDAKALVEHAASLGKLRVVWSKEAVQRVQQRTATVAVDGLPLLEVIYALAEQYGLLCQLKDGGLLVATEAETSRETAAALRMAAARRALRQALLAGPEHHLAVSASLELANDEAAAGNLDEAASLYERLISDSSRSHLPQVSAAYFNLGLVQLMRHNHAAARKSFYRVVDRNPGHELAPRALVQVGWTYLMDSQPQEAIFALRQAQGNADGAPARAAAEVAIALGAAYLLNGNSLEANTVLTVAKAKVNHDPWRTAAGFLDALARFRVAKSGKNTRLEAADLLASLMAFQERPALGSLGQLLAGQAYKDLGMPAQMAKVFEAAATVASGPVAAEMNFALAEHQWSEGKRAPALKLFNALSAAKEGTWGGRARLQLATIACQDGQHQQCIQACIAMLHDNAAVDRAVVFRLMGAAYEQQGDLEKAARCFAGQMPD